MSIRLNVKSGERVKSVNLFLKYSEFFSLIKRGILNDSFFRIVLFHFCLIRLFPEELTPIKCAGRRRNGNAN